MTRFQLAAHRSACCLFFFTCLNVSFGQGQTPKPKKAGSAATATPSPALTGFDAFRLVGERNIFNPNRTPRTQAAAEVPIPRNDTIALVGTMASERGVMAFFDSPDVAYRKTLREGETIAGFTIQKIHSDSIELALGEKQLTMRLTQQLRRPEGGEWRLAASEPFRGAGALPIANGAQSPAASAAIPADASNVLRRLMEQRQKQLKQ